MKSIVQLSIVVVVIGCLAACETSKPVPATTVDRVFKDPNVENAPYTNLLVIGATPSRETTRMIEQGILQELTRVGVEAHSFVKESSSTEATEQAVLEIVNQENVDGVIIISLRLAGGEITTHDERVDVDADVRGGGLLDYFRYDYKETTRPSYSEYTVDVVLKSDFYDVESEKRIYSVESSTAHGETTYEIVSDESKAIVARLKKDRLIP